MVTVNANGVVTAVSVGTATITVTAVDGGHTASATVVVTPIAVTSVSLDRTSLQMFLGKTAPQTLVATILPANATNRDVIWMSSNSDIATISATGVVTAVAAGSTTITVTTVDGSHTATSTVAVATRPVTGVTLNRTSATIIAGQTETLTATIAPANATNRNVTWSSSNPSAATVNANGVVTAVAGGTATITVTTEDGAHTANSVISVLSPTFDHGVVINGIRWATRNVGVPGTFVDNITERGAHFQWNRGTTDWTVGWTGGAATSWSPANDPCPPGWRVPTDGELASLLSSQSQWTNNLQGTGVAGFAKGSSTNAIFLPAAGIRRNSDGALVGVNVEGGYWTATASGTANAWSFVNNSWATWHIASPRSTGFSVRCVAVPNVSVTGVTLNRTTASLPVSGTTTLAATVAPANATNRDVTWSSSNNAVATVNNNGVVTAVSAGTATITVTTADGGRTATNTVTVTASTGGYVVLSSAGIMVQASDASAGVSIRISVCPPTNVGGFTGWRLPSSDELLAIHNARATIGGLQSAWYWSSTSRIIRVGQIQRIEYEQVNPVTGARRWVDGGPLQNQARKRCVRTI